MARNENKNLRRKVRTLYTISTVSIALVLFLLGTVGYLILNALSVTDRMKESVTVNVMLRDKVTDEQAVEVGKRLAALSGVRKAEFVPKAQAAAEFKQYIGTDFEEFLGSNPLPDSYRVGMQADASHKEALTAFEKEVGAWKEVSEVVYQRTVVEQITSNISKFLIILTLFGGTLLVISVVLLNNTIRAAIYSKRYIINTMKLVGATRGFILRPFLRDALLQGIYAALIAIVMFGGMIYGLHQGLADVTIVLQQKQLLLIVGAMLAGGIAISLTFTWVAVNKFINMKTRHIHLY